MKELSLHVLDIAGNSVSAGASLVTIRVKNRPPEICITVEDNGRGMDEEFLRRVSDPFTTTRTTRKVGLGLPLFKLAAEQTGGSFAIKSAPGKGTTVEAKFSYGNIDTPPVGDMAGTMITLIQGSPDIDFIYAYEGTAGAFEMDTREMRELLGGVPLSEPEVLSFISGYITQNEAEAN